MYKNSGKSNLKLTGSLKGILTLGSSTLLPSIEEGERELEISRMIMATGITPRRTLSPLSLPFTPRFLPLNSYFLPLDAKTTLPSMTLFNIRTIPS